MKDVIIILQCPVCSAKQEFESKIMISKKLFSCNNKGCKFGAEHYKWIKIYSDGRVVYPQ